MGHVVANRSIPRARAFAAVVVIVLLGAQAGCSKSSGSAATDASDAATEASDGASEAIPLCAEDGGVDAGAVATSEAGIASDLDDFGPNAPVAKMVSSIGRVNIYAATSTRMLDRADVYLASALAETRVTIAVQEATSMTAPFQKVFAIQLAFDACQGWASTGPIAVPLVAGHYYAIGLDPNQPITAFVSTDTNALPIDGAFGRLVSSKTTTSVSASGLTWEKASTAEFNRQRLATSPRVPDERDISDAATAADGPADAGADGGDGGGGATDAPRG